jgi:hypothetical protein
MAIVPLGADVILQSIPNIIQYPIFVLKIVRATKASIFVRLLV